MNAFPRIEPDCRIFVKRSVATRTSVVNDKWVDKTVPRGRWYGVRRLGAAFARGALLPVCERWRVVLKTGGLRSHTGGFSPLGKAGAAPEYRLRPRTPYTPPPISHASCFSPVFVVFLKKSVLSTHLSFTTLICDRASPYMGQCEVKLL